MSLVFSAIVPHPPVILPTIGHGHEKKLTATATAYHQLASELKAANPETIIIISPHGANPPAGLAINLSPEFQGELAEFGDLATVKNYQGDIFLAQELKDLWPDNPGVKLITQKQLDYGSFLPLAILAETMFDYKILPLYFSPTDLSYNFSLGKTLGTFIKNHNKKIAVIASADLSHRLSRQAPAGYSLKAKKIEQKIIDLLIHDKVEEFLTIDQAALAQAAECGSRSIAMLLGILDQTERRPKQLSYEAPFGVGYLTMSYELKT